MQAQDRGQHLFAVLWSESWSFVQASIAGHASVIRKLHNLESKIFAMMLAPLTSREFVWMPQKCVIGDAHHKLVSAESKNQNNSLCLSNIRDHSEWKTHHSGKHFESPINLLSILQVQQSSWSDFLTSYLVTPCVTPQSILFGTHCCCNNLLYRTNSIHLNSGDLHERECCASSPKPNEPYRNSALGSDSVKKK